MQPEHDSSIMQYQDAKFLISQQKYLELLEAKKPTTALQVLRNDIAPLYVDSESLHTLSRLVIIRISLSALLNRYCRQSESFIMCSDPEDLRKRAGWDGASGTSRQQLLDTLHGKLATTSRFLTYLIILDQNTFHPGS